ncbi:DUF397 domain-containing protein [Actinoplanes sp. TBRC 11911]|uniref:DUF397 domain-containing protein n=1 Tax=Actinoplanes sp. TBRC 11911 TaxID=2729386 RepID=UPI00145C6CAF|nr:DUF397 domain-containing protein [Actinoplanes sp. TBRC 11911]
MTEATDDTRIWRRSTFCADGYCVEVAEDGDRVLMRGSRDTSRRFLSFTRATWSEFMDDIERGNWKGW